MYFLINSTTKTEEIFPSPFCFFCYFKTKSHFKDTQMYLNYKPSYTVRCFKYKINKSHSFIVHKKQQRDNED